jgi:hypothetical protein
MMQIPKSLQVGRYSRRAPTGRVSFQGKEADLQRACEDYLRVMRIRFIRCPDALYKSVFAAGSGVSPRVKAFISTYVRGQPDLVLLSKDGRFLAVELKVGKGQLSQGQLEWARDIEVHVCRSFDEFKELVDGF